MNRFTVVCPHCRAPFDLPIGLEFLSWTDHDEPLPETKAWVGGKLIHHCKKGNKT